MRKALLRGLLLVPLLGAPARASVFDFLPDVLSSQPMPRAPGDGRKDQARAIVLNGFPLYLSTGRTDRSVKDVLDYYQARYPGGVLKDLMGKPVGVRREGNETGTLMVVEVPDRGLADELMAGKRTLVSAGPLRMVYARRSGASTDYLMAWSEKPMPQEVLQPVQSGDAPGKDLPGVPRPSGGARTFSFSEPKAGYQMAMYEVPADPENALRGAAARIGGDGWQEDRTFGEAARKRQKLVARFSKGSLDVVVTARPAKGGGPGQTQLIYLMRDL